MPRTYELQCKECAAHAVLHGRCRECDAIQFDPSDNDPDHAERTTKHFDADLGFCICQYCSKLPLWVNSNAEIGNETTADAISDNDTITG